MELNYDVGAEQIKNVEYSIGRLIEQRDLLMKVSVLGLEELEKVDVITKKILKRLKAT